ncbi:hypothetical protein Tco_0221207 [Tanacetum coccineum]
MKLISDEEEVAVDAIPLATKPLSIVDLKIVKEGKINYYQIIRADGSSRRPDEGYERVLWGDLKTIFEHHVEDAVFQNLHVFMLVEKRYPLIPATITEMLNKKLQGRIVGIKRLLDDLRVTTAKLMLLVYKLLLLVFRVNVAGTKLQLLKG